MKRTLASISAWTLAAVVALSLPLRAQESAVFKKEEIEQLVAPIALYPDALVAQVLMASTYPLEVVQAARWSKANPELKDKALQDALEKQPWDPSVKSLTAFPGTLAMMSDRLDWTQKLGDAFLAQQKEVLAAVQQLRSRAQAAGNLKSTKEQKVTTEQQNGTTVIKIEPTDPQVVYVPTYNTTVVYGSWPYPAYPPYYWPPPVYYPPGTVFFGFTVGIAIGAAWGGCHWGGGNVYVDHRTYNNFNRTDIKTGDWQHRPEHRKGVEYRDQASRDKFGGGQRPGVDSREQFRGRAEQGRQDIARAGPEGMDRDRGGSDRASGRDVGVGDRQRDAGGTGDRGADAGLGGRQPDAFDGVGSGGQTRDFSNRGAASRASAAGRGRGGGGRR